MLEKEFSVWAPKAHTVSLIVFSNEESAYPMIEREPGFFTVTLKNDAEIEYMFVLDEQKRRPDPRSFWQPYGVHGASRTYDHNAFSWEDSDWQKIAKKDYIIYELHVGTFTSEGTFEAIITQLPYLKVLGITAIELMPVIEFPGGHNWGYDGTYPYAPHHSYGGPDGLKKLINACHKAGIAVIIDLVYNHFGPEGNYLGDFGEYFTDTYKTPWGQAINYDGRESNHVREYFIDNALYWIDKFHVDAFRLDAIHAIFDMSAVHILKELKQAIQKKHEGIYVFAESDLNDVRILSPCEIGGYALDAQWNDDFHHALHALITGSRHTYFQDFGSIADVAKAYSNGFVYDGKYSQYRKKVFGSSSKGSQGDQFIVTLQNHDQIGNATFGARLNTLITEDQYRLVTMVFLCAPNIPLLFMGQEWAATTPFLYFTSFEDQDLVRSIYEGYIKENNMQNLSFEQFKNENVDRFLQSKLDWQELNEPKHQNMLHYYQQLILLRKTTPSLSNCRKDLTKVTFSEQNKWLIIHRTDATTSSSVVLFANFSTNDQFVPFPLLEERKWILYFQSTWNTFNDTPQVIVPGQEVFLKGYSATLYRNED